MLNTLITGSHLTLPTIFVDNAIRVLAHVKNSDILISTTADIIAGNNQHRSKTCLI